MKRSFATTSSLSNFQVDSTFDKYNISVTRVSENNEIVEGNLKYGILHYFELEFEKADGVAELKQNECILQI